VFVTIWISHRAAIIGPSPVTSRGLGGGGDRVLGHGGRAAQNDWHGPPAVWWARRAERSEEGLMRDALLFIDLGFAADLKDVTRIDDVELGDPGARRRR
jgi:hypothetical protein